MSNKSYAFRSYQHCVQKYSKECEIFKFFVGSTYTNFVEMTVLTLLSVDPEKTFADSQTNSIG